jgi:phosphoribosylformimino-5-aminoimidazole carboxamide ribotide isomerase
VILIPAIDIRDGRAVRLNQGDFARETVYAEDPLQAARTWVEQGARRLHVVDLDGARSGEPRNLGHLRRITAELPAAVQYGGGLRTAGAAALALEAGAERVIVGTAALADERFLDSAQSRLGERVAVAVDARAGTVSVAGWSEDTDERAEESIARLAARGVGRVVFTDVGRDGTLAGPDLDAVRRVAQAAGPATRLIYSGGVGSLEDLRALGALTLANLDGVITGKALYEGRFTVAEGQATLDEATAVH